MNIHELMRGLRRTVRRGLRIKAESLRKEQSADLFLRHLSRKNVYGSDAILLNFLDDKNIYYDAASLKEVIDLLLEKNLIKEIPETMAAVAYFDSVIDGAAGSSITAGSSIMHPSHWLNNIEGTIKQSEITAKGKHFIRKGQKLDTIGLAEAKASRAKWLERLITLGIALVTAVGVTLLTEPIKQVFAERKEAKKEIINESSPVRPRLDPRQRPEPRKSAPTAASRS